MSNFLFTSESVTEGHPDKLCDQVSDAILDYLIAKDPMSRVACETLTKTGFVIIAGEITTNAWAPMPTIVRQVVNDIGYNSTAMGFDYSTCAVLTAIEQQSSDIAQGVEGRGAYSKNDLGAGDQGMMFGYACRDTPELMPMPIMLAHQITKRLAKVRKDGSLPFLRPDGKSQVSVRYEDYKPVAIETVVVSTQHSEDVSHKRLRDEVIEAVVMPVLPKKLIVKKPAFFINPTGRFVTGGPLGDSGLTGRKIIVDTYGGWARHGGGAFSGKDPTKVDRSASYFARYMAKHVVAAGLAERCEVQLAYAIGVARPVSLLVETFGTGVIDDARLAKLLESIFDARPAAIIEELDLLKPRYRATASYGHFGRRESSFTWEATPRVEELRAAAKLPASGGGKRPARPSAPKARKGARK
ncbi:MAG: methionine adenosyltransferase [Polyangia bacterium]|jgi:S-adenosylmethionine synthetase|nr:methionine adenosyltransferase [Polyangia bacterium]